MNIADPPLPGTKRHQPKRSIALRATTPYSTKYSGAARYLHQMRPTHTAFTLGGTNTNHPHFALASGRIWDDKLKKFAAWKDLVNHPDDNIASRWEQSGVNEFARLFQGYRNIEGLDVLEWINKRDVPPGQKVTYPRYTVAYRPEKDEPYRTRITAGGNLLDYDGNTTTHSASMETIKVHWNSTISTPNARYCTADISNMYLCSELPDAQYVKFPVSQIPLEIINAYHLNDKIDNGFVYVKIKKAWYGLRESGKIAHDDLVKHLRADDYYETATAGLFTHKTRDISFTLVVDDFGIKYINEDDVTHLRSTIEKHYPVKFKMNPDQYIGITLKFDYEKGEVICSMDGYIEDALREFEHMFPTQHHYGPSKHIDITYGAKVQYAVSDTAPNLTPAQIKYIQQVTGKLLFYARAIDNTMLHTLNMIATTTITGTTATLDAANYLLNYAACNPNAEIRFRASDMILNVHSDAAYLVAPEARSRAGGFHFLGTKDRAQFNGPILVLARTIKNVVTSAAESEISALFMNAREAIPIRRALINLGHHQPPTPIVSDNSTAVGIIKGTMKQKQSKSFNKEHNWLRDRMLRGYYDYHWEKGTTNLGDYPTKKHPPQHHRRVRPIQLYIENESPTTMEQCSAILQSAHSPKSFDMTKQGCVRKRTGAPPPLITKAAHGLTLINHSQSNISRRRSNIKPYMHIKQSSILSSYLL